MCVSRSTSGRQQVRALAQAGERRRVHVVALRAQEPRQVLVAPSAVRRAVHEYVRRHRWSAFAVPGTCRDTLARNGFLAGHRALNRRGRLAQARRVARELLGGERARETDDGQDEDHLAIGREDRCGERRDCILGVVAAREERVLVEREFDQDLVELVMASGIIGCAARSASASRADGASRCRAPRHNPGRAPVRVPPGTAGVPQREASGRRGRGRRRSSRSRSTR